MRQRFKPTGKKRTGLKYQHSNFTKVMTEYKEWFDLPNDENKPSPPEPSEPVSYSTFSRYRSALKDFHLEQIANHATNLVWEQIWTLPCRNLDTTVKTRQFCCKKANDIEKLDEDIAPYGGIEKLAEIEHEFWIRGYQNRRSAFLWIRHRFCFLFTTTAILHCESIFGADLSDFLSLKVQGPTDVHQLMVLVMQIALGKFLQVCCCV